jgi:hypothetical protein
VFESIQLAEKSSADHALFARRLTLSDQAPLGARALTRTTILGGITMRCLLIRTWKKAFIDSPFSFPLARGNGGRGRREGFLLVMLKAMRFPVAAVVVAILAPAPVTAGPVLEFNTGVPIGISIDSTVGWAFTTNSAITVTALDAYLVADSTVTSTNVRLYGANAVTLASATVSTSDTLEGSPFAFYSHTLAAAVTLAANTTYYIAEDTYEGGNAATSSTLYALATGVTTDPSITYLNGVDALEQLGANPTSGDISGIYGPDWFGPNFDIAPAAVPEPSSLVLMCMGGIAGLGYAWRRRRAKVVA